MPADALGCQCRDRRALVRADLEEGLAVVGESPRQLVEEAPDDRQSVGAAVEREPRFERRADGPPGERVELRGPHIRKVRNDEVIGIRPRGRRQQVGRFERDPVSDPMDYGVLARQIESVHRDVDRGDLDVGRRHPPCAQGDRQRNDDRAAAGPDVDDAKRAGSVDPAGQAGHDLGDRPVDEQLGLWPRDERSRVHRQRDPVEFLDAAQVGHRLAQFPPIDQGQVLRFRVDPDRRVGVGDDGRPVDADREREQELGIQTRRVGSCRA